MYSMMSKKSFSANYFVLIPLVFSSILCIFLVYFLDQKTTNTPVFFETLQDQISTFIGISGLTAIALLGYIVFSIFGINRIIVSGDNKLNALIEKMNAARKVIEIIYKSKLWRPEVKTFIDDEFEDALKLTGGQLVPVLVNAIKELKARIEVLENE